MRINKLNLLRYGKFTELALDFGQYQANTPDLHVIYGPNEAGKTTLMSAYLDLLFGFETKTPYNFKHANTALKIGAELTMNDQTQTLQRLKKNKNSLVDGDDQPIDDIQLLQQLAGLTKKSYQNMFSLNDDTLEEGGESILASEGDLGKLLYSATTGVAQLSDALLRLRAESDQFYKKGKRAFELAELKTRLKQIDTDRKSIDVEARAYSKLTKQRDEADAQYRDLGASHSKLKVQIQKLRRAKTAFPRFNSLKRLQAEMLPLGTLPDTPSDWIENARALQIDGIKLSTTEQELIKSISLLDVDIDKTTLDDAALAARTQWKQVEQYRDNYLIASNNLPDLHQQLRLCKLDIEGILHKLDRVNEEHPRKLILNASTQSTIKELIKQQPERLLQLQTAKKELSNAQEQNNSIQDKFTQQGGNTDAVNGLAALRKGAAAMADLMLSIAPFTNNELHSKYRNAQQQQAMLTDDLDIKMAALTPWSGDAQALQSITVPHISTLLSLQSTRDKIAENTNEEMAAHKALEKKLKQLQAQQKSFNATGLVDEAESRNLRAQRDNAWQEHKTQLDSNTATIFEKAMHADDASLASRLQHTESLAHINQLSRDIMVTEESLVDSDASLAGLKEEQHQLLAETSQLINDISPLLDSSMTIEAVGAWINSRSETLEVFQQLKSVDRELESIESQASDACATILGSLKSAGIAEDTTTKTDHSVNRLSSLLETANSAIKHENSLNGLRDQLINSQHQLSTRSSEVDTAQALFDQWTNEWQQVCERCWFGSNKSIPTISNIEEFLPQLALLEQHINNQSKLEEQVAQHQAVLDNYDQMLSKLANSLKIPTENIPVEQLYNTLLERIETAIETQQSLTATRKQKDELVEQQKAIQAKRSIMQASVLAMTSHFSVNNIDEVQLKLVDVSRKHELQKRINSEQNELLETLSVESLTDAIAFFNEFDSDENQLKLDELERDANQLELQLREAHTLREDARRAVQDVGGDDEVALLQEKRANLLLVIEEKITRYLQQHLALNAADAALKTYRDNHRSSMITKASDVFSRISQGRYTRLDTFQDGTSEQLIIIDKDSGSKETHKLSKGTRFQLYLALRIAGYHEYASSRPSVPFIADDIMETSDDERAGNTFEVLGEMASVGQVIYLTHHQHLCDIARRAVPGCVIHELP